MPFCCSIKLLWLHPSWTRQAKGMLLYLTTNEPSSLRSLLWLFKYTFVGVSKTIWKCNYHVFHLHKYTRDGFIFVLQCIIHVLASLPPRIFPFSANISGAKKVMLYFQSLSIKGNLEKMCVYPRAPSLQALGNDSRLFTRGFFLMWSRCWNI
jgi:hypothetical protein